MIDVTQLSVSAKTEIADIIKRYNLEKVNEISQAVLPPNTFYVKYGKRLLDVVISLLAIIITLPINLIIAVVTYFDVGRPIIFKQKRTGRNRKDFQIIKFRNMTNAVDAQGELLPASQRVTEWGKFVRKTSLDELLNFVSVFKGDMSIIGPRPLLDYYATRMNIRHASIYTVRPGLECPPIKKTSHVINWQERLDNYVWYVEHLSFLMDIKLFLRVIQETLDPQKTKIRGDAGNGGFMGYDKNGNVIYSKSVPDEYVLEYLSMHNYRSIDEAILARNRHE